MCPFGDTNPCYFLKYIFLNLSDPYTLIECLDTITKVGHILGTFPDIMSNFQIIIFHRILSSYLTSLLMKQISFLSLII